MNDDQYLQHCRTQFGAFADDLVRRTQSLDESDSLRELALAFDLFYTTKEVGEGTGLGLSIVHNIVTNHGGRIDIRSSAGEGTVFTIRIPRLTTREEAS